MKNPMQVPPPDDLNSPTQAGMYDAAVWVASRSAQHQTDMSYVRGAFSTLCSYLVVILAANGKSPKETVKILRSVCMQSVSGVVAVIQEDAGKKDEDKAEGESGDA